MDDTAIAPLPYRLSDEGTNNTVTLGKNIVANPKRFTIHFKGSNNSVEIADGCHLSNLEVSITGDHNKVVVGRKTRINARLHCKGDKNKILVGKLNSIVEGTLHAEYGTTIKTGVDCIFSRGLIIRTGDSHSVIDIATLERVNQPKSITLHERVWCGYDVSIMKGVTIGPDSIVAACAVVTKSFPAGRSVLAGIPAKVVQTGVFWDRRALGKKVEPGFMLDALRVRGIERPPSPSKPARVRFARVRQALASACSHKHVVILYAAVVASLLLHLWQMLRD